MQNADCLQCIAWKLNSKCYLESKLQCKHYYAMTTLDDELVRCNHDFIDACRMGLLEAVKWLSCDMDSNNELLNDIHSGIIVALQRASQNGHLEVVKYLINLGLNSNNELLNDIRSEDNYALRYAACNGHFEVVKYLISFGLTIDDIRSRNMRALQLAAHNGHLEVVKYLQSIA